MLLSEPPKVTLSAEQVETARDYLVNLRSEIEKLEQDLGRL
jgi:hypothetical protein